MQQVKDSWSYHLMEPEKNRDGILLTPLVNKGEKGMAKSLFWVVAIFLGQIWFRFTFTTT